MTGEITLSGLVLPVGGIKEKVLAAHRAGLKRIILPSENRKDLTDVSDHVRDALEFVFAERIEDVLRSAIPTLPEPLATEYSRTDAAAAANGVNHSAQPRTLVAAAEKAYQTKS